MTLYLFLCGLLPHWSVLIEGNTDTGHYQMDIVLLFIIIPHWSVLIESNSDTGQHLIDTCVVIFTLTICSLPMSQASIPCSAS